MNATDFTTAPKTRYEIIDQASGDTAGVAPGIDARDALETFSRDALNSAGSVTFDETSARWILTWDGSTFEAEKIDAPTADLENGPHPDEDTLCDVHEAGACPAGCQYAHGYDQRYDQDAIDNLDDARLEQHLESRREQLARARADMDACHATLARLEDPDSRTYTDTIANLGSYTREHAIQKRIIRQLETEQAKRQLDRQRDDDADGREPQIDLIDEAIAARGLMVGLRESDDTDLAAALWMHATMALEADSDGNYQPTNVKVAERVADAIATLYGIR